MFLLLRGSIKYINQNFVLSHVVFQILFFVLEEGVRRDGGTGYGRSLRCETVLTSLKNRTIKN